MTFLSQCEKYIGRYLKTGKDQVLVKILNKEQGYSWIYINHGYMLHKQYAKDHTNTNIKIA